MIGKHSAWVCQVGFVKLTNSKLNTFGDWPQIIAEIKDFCTTFSMFNNGKIVNLTEPSVMHKATTKDLPADRLRTLWRTIISGEATG